METFNHVSLSRNQVAGADCRVQIADTTGRNLGMGEPTSPSRGARGPENSLGVLVQEPSLFMAVIWLYDPELPTLLYSMAETAWQYQLPPISLEPCEQRSAKAGAPKARTAAADSTVKRMVAGGSQDFKSRER